MIISDINTINKIVKNFIKDDIKICSDSSIDLGLDVESYELSSIKKFSFTLNIKKELLSKYKQSTTNDISWNAIDVEKPIKGTSKPMDVEYIIIPGNYGSTYRIKKADILAFLRQSKLSKVSF